MSLLAAFWAAEVIPGMTGGRSPDTEPVGSPAATRRSVSFMGSCTVDVADILKLWEAVLGGHNGGG